jgi:hypothetical protein
MPLPVCGLVAREPSKCRTLSIQVPFLHVGAQRRRLWIYVRASVTVGARPTDHLCVLRPRCMFVSGARNQVFLQLETFEEYTDELLIVHARL